jgi:hypothetical protein
MRFIIPRGGEKAFQEATFMVNGYSSALISSTIHRPSDAIFGLETCRHHRVRA